jgi:hypothetical protein
MDGVFLNDRVFEQGRRVKCLITRPPGSGGGAKPEARFRLLDAAGKPTDSKPQSPRGLRLPRAEQTQFSVAELPTDVLPVGSFFLEAEIAGKQLMRKEILIAKRGSLLEALSHERFGLGTEIRSADDMAARWMAAWHETWNYLATATRIVPAAGPVPPFSIVAQAPTFTTSGPVLTVPVTLEAFEWACAHAVRFLVDQLFYGGDVGLQGFVQRDVLELKIPFSAHTPIEAESFAQLRSVLEAVPGDGYRLVVNWFPPGPSNPASAALDLQWRKG